MDAILLISLLFVAGAQPHEFSLQDLMQFKCDRGDQAACDEVEQIKEDREDTERLQDRVNVFGQQLQQRNLMLDDRRPDLESAYPLVMNDYFAALRESGEEPQIVSKPQLQQCAAHYHDHWINRKLWWPNEDGRPDWDDIYVFIVDHYYGFCLRAQ